ncbi:MAG: TonB-dependent receptor, partial [Woeseiaceae bacterium]|nr:TonB-dependent receptor [Woeseiaceae bacterium]
MRLLITILALAALAPAAALAEDGVEGIDEIVVTAMRRPVRADSLAFSIGTVEADAVAFKPLLTDAIDNVVGVALQQTTPGQGAAIVRGQRGSAVLHLVDGFRLNNAIFRSAPTQYLALVPSGSVERVEVLKGTPASLYGSDAVGGVIQVVTRRPQFDSDATQVRGEVRAAGNSAESMRRLGATVDAGNSSVFSSFSADWLDMGDRRVGGGATIAPTGYESGSGRALFGWRPDDATTWSIDLQYLEQPETPRIDELVPGFGQTEPSSSEFLFRPNRRSFVLARYENTAGPFDATWTVSAGWQRIDDDRVSRDFGAPTRVIEQNRSDLLGVSASIGHIDAGKSWVVGVEYYDDTVRSARQDQDIVSGAVTNVQPRFPDDSSVRQLGAYANSTWTLNPTHSISGGLRVSLVTTGIAPTPLTAAGSLDNNDVSGDLGWAMNLGPEWHVTANAGFGFRAPNVFDVGTLGNRPGNRFNIPKTALESEHVLQGEIGVRYGGSAG